jgi:cell division protein FtsI/penicillin-binding protein 2
MKTLSSFVFLSNKDKFSVSSEQKYFCNGKFEEPKNDYFKVEDKIKFNLIEDSKTGKNYFKCSKEKGHGEITMYKALAESCNAYYLHFASKNSDLFYNTLIHDWRLDEGTGASFEGNSNTKSSIGHNPTQFESTLKSIGDDGQIKLTALKVAQIYGAIFADTPILMPILKGETPRQVSPFPYSDSIRRNIQQALRLTVKEGTLKNIHLQNTSIQILSGKTGTPTREGKKFTTHGWNIIYFKKGDNSYLLVVFIDKGSGKKEALELSTIILNSI